MNTSKKMVALSLTVLLLFSCMPAFAETTITASYVVDGRNASLNRYSNTIASYVTEKSNSYYVLTDAYGNRQTTDYYLAMNAEYGYWKVAQEAGTNNLGLIDASGHVIMPLNYGAINVISERWTIGVELEPATAEQYDYRSFDSKTFYLVSAYDVYFEGVKVGSLSRTQYRSAYAHGNYLYVQDAERNSHYYNKDFVESSYPQSITSEYCEVYEKGVGTTVWHAGSGQQAFTAGCTLTSDEVAVDVYFLDGKILDLHGNVIGELNMHYDYVRQFKGDYTTFKVNGKYGLIDQTGKVVLPAEYDEIPYFNAPDGSEKQYYFPCGYQVVVKNEKLGYVDLNGNVTCDFKYAASSVRYSTNPNFASVQDLEGNYIILSASSGELPQRYQDVNIPYSWSRCIAVQNSADAVGVVDMNANEVIPFDASIKYASNYTFANDGSVFLCGNSGQTTVYVIGNKNAAATAPVTSSESTEEQQLNSLLSLLHSNNNEASSSEQKQQQEPADDNSWVCDCGSTNTENFCPQCGAARPAEEKIIVCTGCGYQPDQENVPNFCPECGQKFAK